MTSYAPNWTPRWKGEYHAAGLNHSITLRKPRGTLAAAMITVNAVAFNLFDNAATALADDFEWISAQYALTDSDVWVPSELPDPITGLADADSYSISQRISPYTFSGRSASGRARFSMYGIGTVMEAGSGVDIDYQVLASEETFVADIIAEAQASLVGNAGEATVWHNRATIKPNDRLVKLARRGIVS